MRVNIITLKNPVNPIPLILSKIKTLFWENWQTISLVYGCYAFLTIITIPQLYLYYVEVSDLARFPGGIGRAAFSNFLWASLTLVVFWLGNRFLIERPNLFRNLFLHLIFGLIFATIHKFAWFYLYGFFMYGDAIDDIHAALFRSWSTFINYVTTGFVYYVAILGVGRAVDYFRKYRNREFRLQQAEFDVLKMQLHPHFLFNTLNAISALIYISPERAEETISQLSDLLRMTLHNTKTQEVILKDEIDYLRKYIQIQQTLLQERLEIEWAIDPETLDALVPNMLLQPLVENSIRHGIAPKEEGGIIEIFSRQVNNNLLLEIKDTGVGSELNLKNKTGIGLKNSAARLKHIYGEAQRFESGAVSGGGWRVTVTIPFREQRQTKVIQ